MIEQNRILGSRKAEKTARGVVNPRFVRIAAFTVISISLFICTILTILAIWEFTKSDAIWRAVATFGVIAFAMVVFTIVNERFGYEEKDGQSDA